MAMRREPLTDQANRREESEAPGTLIKQKRAEEMAKIRGDQFYLFRVMSLAISPQVTVVISVAQLSYAAPTWRHPIGVSGARGRIWAVHSERRAASRVLSQHKQIYNIYINSSL